MALPLEINCLVLGDDPSHVFPVEIASNKTVGTLKELIKEKKQHAFEHVDADTLELFKVSFPVDDDLHATLKNFHSERDAGRVQYLSRSVARLKGLFGDLDDEHIHLIVQPPPAGE